MIITFNTSSRTFQTCFTLSLFLFSIILLGSSAYSWTNPSGTPPNNNVAAPVNVGSTAQTKNGPLGVNGLSNSGSSHIAGKIGVGTSPYDPWKIVAGGGTYGIYGTATTGQAIRGYATTGYAGYFTIGTGETGGGVYASNGVVGTYLGYPNSSWGIYTNGNSYTSGQVQIGGNVGIGLSNPPNKLHVSGNIGATGWIGAGCEGSCEGSGGYSLLYADGRIVSTNSVNSPAFYYTSDESLKYDIKNIHNATDIIKQLRGVAFNWNEDGRADIGLIAQEVEEVLPELVHTDSITGLKSVEYANLVAPLIEAVKEQQEEIDELQSQLKILSERLDVISK